MAEEELVTTTLAIVATSFSSTSVDLASTFDYDYLNNESNATEGVLSTPEPTELTFYQMWNFYLKILHDRWFLVVVLLVFALVTVLGNLLVVMAVCRERYLHNSTNYFIASLAFADGLVGLVVMPCSAMYEVLEHTWFFGMNWCDLWRSLDVLFSTASILNLCVISLDRYWAITDPISYPRRMSGLKAALLIAAVWICSSAISFPAILWWRAVRSGKVAPLFKCPFTDNLEYIIFSSLISFYLPLFIMVFTYYKIYRAATYQTQAMKIGSKQVKGKGKLPTTLRIHRGGTVRQPRELPPGSPEDPDREPLTAIHNRLSRSVPRLNNVHSKNIPKNFSLSRKLTKFAKEKKAAKTLGIVMGVFIICWLPFFVMNLLTGFCSTCIAHQDTIGVVVTWLGWVNSAMNPFIYACWSRDFRRGMYRALLRLCCWCCPGRVRRHYQQRMRFRQTQIPTMRYSASSQDGVRRSRFT